MKSPNEENNANEESWSIIFPPWWFKNTYEKKRKNQGQFNPGRWTDRFVWERKPRIGEPGGRGMATGLGEPARSEKAKFNE